MPWTLCTSGSAADKAGISHCSAISGSAVSMATFSDATEGLICARLHTDIVTNYASYDVEIKNALAEWASSAIAMKIAGSDNTGYLAREWDGIMNLNDEIISSCVVVLDKMKLRFSS